jgi:hypothetical protein
MTPFVTPTLAADGSVYRGVMKDTQYVTISYDYVTIKLDPTHLFDSYFSCDSILTL